MHTLHPNLLVQALVSLIYIVIQLNKNVWDFWVVIFNQFIIELHIIMQGIHIPCEQSYSTYSYSEAAHYEHSYSKHNIWSI